MINQYKKISLSIGIILALSTFSVGQSNEFTYQGRLLDNNLPMTAVYDFEFSLWDALANGTQAGATQAVTGVAVTNGIFTVRLNFGAQFDGSPRFLQITVRPAGGGAFTTLAPRQPITSAPYAIRSLNSTTADTATNSMNLGGVAASQYVVTTDPRMTDSRNPLPNSGNYIWNQNSVLQPSSNFVISGNGDVGGTLSGNIVNATTQFNLGSNRILYTSGTTETNLFIGVNSGSTFPTAFGNTFVGNGTGGPVNNLTLRNSLFGTEAGTNVMFNSNNSYFGYRAGFINSGPNNAFFGTSSGVNSTFGSDNTFIGSLSGQTNTIGDNNTLIGAGADVGANNLNFATAIGAGAVVGLSNTILLGRIDGSDMVQIPGQLQLASLAGGGVTNLCRTATTFIASCSSSLRYKTNIHHFSLGLKLINQLKPITFDWKDGGMRDFGLGAEDVAAIEPLLVTYNKNGEVEGVKYDRIGVIAVNAIKEQQAEISELRAVSSEQAKKIEDQNSKIKDQQVQIDALKKLVCAQTPSAEICKEDK